MQPQLKTQHSSVPRFDFFVVVVEEFELCAGILKFRICEHFVVTKMQPNHTSHKPFTLKLLKTTVIF